MRRSSSADARCAHHQAAVVAQSETTSAACPDCACVSFRGHSRYIRHLADLPWGRRAVRLIIRVRRFFCTRWTCARKTFAEALPAVAERYARRTLHLKETLVQLGLALGGEAGARLAATLKLPCSPDILLRCVRRVLLEPVGKPRVIGLDEWAYRRGHRSGSIICDLERHRPLDLLPDREVASVAVWLKRYPSIEVISRDRSGGFAEAARQGAPQAIQGADRWHVQKNLGEALEVLLVRHLTAHRKKKTMMEEPEKPVQLEKRSHGLTARQEQVVQIHRAERLARYEQVISLSKQGLSQEAIAQCMGMGHSTVGQWLAAGTFPERKRREQSSRLDPYLPYALKRWSQGCHTITRIYQELKKQGYKGAYETVHSRLTPLRQHAQAKLRTYFSESSPLVSSRQATRLLLRQSDELSAEERETVTTLRQLHPDIELAYGFVQEFVQMLHMRTGEKKLDGWLEAVEKSSLTDLQSFVAGVYQDKAAVQAGLTRPESNDHVA
jgi:transposase